MRKTLGVLAFGVMAAFSGVANSVALTDGGLTMNVRDDNGAINDLQFIGNEYYRLGAFVADYGFQRGTDTSTFRKNDTNGGVDFATATIGGGTTATVTGNVGFDTGILFTRTYTLLNGNALRITTTLTNTTATDQSVRIFDTLDPDQGTPQGLGPGTVNDIAAGVATSTAGTRSVAFTSGQSGALVLAYGGSSSPFGLGVFDGSSLNAAFATPYDPDGADEDIGVLIGIEELLSAGEVFTFTHVHGYGLDAVAATSAALAAIPEPATLALLGLGLLGIGMGRRRQQDRA